MDTERFSNLCQQAASQPHSRSGIGTLSEKTLHLVLKNYFEPDNTKHEVKIGRYVADIAGKHGIIEIQTQGFHAIRKKLEQFLKQQKVTLVYPIAKTKWLFWIDEESGEISKRRKSPKTGTPYSAFFELYKIKFLLTNPNLRLCLLFLDMEEYRYLNGWSADKKKGATRCERIPTALVEELYIRSREDYRLFIPAQLPHPFTTKDYAKAAGLTLSAAQKAVHVLHFVGVLKRTGKRGRLYLYERENL